MKYSIFNENDAELKATLEIGDSYIILHSRGGTIGSRNERNSQYSSALRIIFKRIIENKLDIIGAWVDSSRVKNIPLEHRQIIFQNDLPNTHEQLFKLATKRMQLVGRSPHSISSGNSNKRIKIIIHGQTKDTIARKIKAYIDENSVPTKRLNSDDLEKITPEHVWLSVIELTTSGTYHKFGPSTDYDLVTDTGLRLPPKAVFGRAVELALGFEVAPSDFTSGIRSRCFRKLKESGYDIVSKDKVIDTDQKLSFDERVWTEGKPRLAFHMRRERGRGLSEAKKAEFKRRHGRLYCERCNMSPIEIYGSVDGEACIEVHHNKTAVSQMPVDHETRLNDLQCLCANCHRYVHHVMRRQS